MNKNSGGMPRQRRCDAMSGENQPTDKRDTEMFASLVMMLTTSAMQQLGKLPNPLTGKIEVNLDAAQWTIDVIVMLRDKMRGNLTGEEQKLLNDAITSLQLNFVETASSAATPQQSGAAASETGTPGNASPTREESGKDSDRKPPKFRKTYGAS